MDKASMAHVRGIGGIFFKSGNPEALYAWYQEHLGIDSRPGEGASFPWGRSDDSSQEHVTAWSKFASSTKYFKDSQASFILNYIVDDLYARWRTFDRRERKWTRSRKNASTVNSAGNGPGWY